MPLSLILTYSVCLSVCLFACQAFCLSACHLPDWLSIYLMACLHAYHLLAYQSACLHAYLPGWPAYQSTFLQSCLPAYMSALQPYNLQASLLTCMPSQQPACLPIICVPTSLPFHQPACLYQIPPYQPACLCLFICLFNIIWRSLHPHYFLSPLCIKSRTRYCILVHANLLG